MLKCQLGLNHDNVPEGCLKIIIQQQPTSYLSSIKKSPLNNQCNAIGAYVSNIQPHVCAPDTGLVVREASLQSCNSIPVTTFPCQLSQGAVTRGCDQVLKESFHSFLPLTVLWTSLPRRKALLDHLGASVNSPCLDRSSCGLLG